MECTLALEFNLSDYTEVRLLKLKGTYKLKCACKRSSYQICHVENEETGDGCEVCI